MTAPYPQLRSLVQEYEKQRVLMASAQKAVLDKIVFTPGVIVRGRLINL